MISEIIQSGHRRRRIRRAYNASTNGFGVRIELMDYDFFNLRRA